MDKVIDCSQHKKEVAGISDMKVLAEMIGDLHYETLMELLDKLCLKLREDGNKDMDKGRLSLGQELVEASYSIYQVHWHIKQAWQISKPFMEDKIKNNKHER